MSRQAVLFLVGFTPSKRGPLMKKPATLICLAVAFTALTAAIKVGVAAEPVDVFVTPVPATPGTTAAILPPSTYHAVRQDGVQLSGLVHSSDVAKFSMPSRAPSALWPQKKMPKHNPGLRFVSVTPQPQGMIRVQPSR
jgi:hypothetical protein